MFNFIPLKAWLILGAAALMFGLGWSVNGAYNRAKIAELETTYERERLASIERALETEKAFRAVEQSWQSDVAAAVAEGQAAIALRDRAISALQSTNGKLSNRIAANERANEAAPDTAATIANFRHQIGILRLVVGELDDFAGEAVKAADAYRDELALCRQYARTISP